jgi:hypothetical protein
VEALKSVSTREYADNARIASLSTRCNTVRGGANCATRHSCRSNASDQGPRHAPYATRVCRLGSRRLSSRSSYL